MPANSDPLTNNISMLKTHAFLDIFPSAASPVDTGKTGADLTVYNKNKNTTYRFLITLFSRHRSFTGLESGKYSLGLQIVWFTYRFLESIFFSGTSHAWFKGAGKAFSGITCEKSWCADPAVSPSI